MADPDIPINPAAFSPDRKKFVIQSCDLQTEEYRCQAYKLLMIDIGWANYTEILPDVANALKIEDPYGMILEWTDPGTILITEDTYGMSEPRRWQLDINTGQVSENVR